jgi:hypothetical protein
VTRRRRVRGQARRPVAGSLWIETFEGSRPEFGRAIAYWGFNRNSATKCGNFATQRLIGHIAVRRRIGSIAVALPNSSTRKRPLLRGFVLTALRSPISLPLGRIVDVAFGHGRWLVLDHGLSGNYPPTLARRSRGPVVFPEREFLARTAHRSRVADLPPVKRAWVNAYGAVPVDRAGRPRPALVRNQAKPDQGVGLRARAPAPQGPTRPWSKLGREWNRVSERARSV